MEDYKKEAEAFKKGYEELCKKHEMQIASYPTFRYSQESQDFRVQIVTEIIKTKALDK